jgi:hypothetical protein
MVGNTSLSQIFASETDQPRRKLSLPEFVDPLH